MSDRRSPSQRTWVRVGLAPKLRRQWAYWPEFKCRACLQFGWTVALAAIDSYLEGTLSDHSFRFAHAAVAAECRVEHAPGRIMVTILSFECTEPDGPDPDGGERARPRAVAGLYLLLSGTDGEHEIVDLCGNVPELAPYDLRQCQAQDWVGSGPFLRTGNGILANSSSWPESSPCRTSSLRTLQGRSRAHQTAAIPPPSC